MDFPKSIGWIGLGAMGFPMALQLDEKAPEDTIFHVYDINNEAVNSFMSSSVHDTVGCRSAKEVTDKSECGNMSAKYTSTAPQGLSPRLTYPENSSSTESSTIDIATSLLVGRKLQDHHLQSHASNNANPPRFFDAPVSGGTVGASKGALTIMLGCAADAPDLPLLKQIMSTMGTNVYTLGGPSLGLAAKLSNNYLSGMIALATSEAMNLGMRLGIEPGTLQRVFSTSSGGSWVNDTVNPVPGVCPDAVTSKGYEGGFKVQLMKKDMGLAIDAAQEVGAKLVLADAGLGAYTAASEDPRCRDRDSRVVYRWLGGVEPEKDENIGNIKT
ncbi:hypothetical protein D9619_011695 [Psilocybe cf. subviscida]|uniref:3-hydroxyisobutyrate dehydrogenase n=1 Tax=Psilocybe cf. subviscida TaxID=2480587 RepID=A0A8H5BSE5_9AGAR|nr:hypothetical protein D9619_011695 [Psilocybe cf. subviscida]